jgi:hypothetical protein
MSLALRQKSGLTLFSKEVVLNFGRFIEKRGINMKTTKHILFDVSGVVLMLAGFIIGLLVFIYFSIPFLKSLGPDPNRLVVIFVVLPLMVAAAAVFAYLGIAVNMIVWKQFLTNEQAKEYIFEPVTPRSEIPKVFNILFVKPYYRLASFIYPKVRGQFE